MRRMLGFLLLFFPCACLGSPAGESFANTEFNIISNKMMSDTGKITQGFGDQDKDTAIQEIENILKSKDPELVSYMQNENNESKLVVYRSRLAELAFDEYVKSFISMLEYRSRETGRKLQHKQIKSEKSCWMYDTYWLDRGDLDSSKCKPPYDGSSKQWVDWMTENACYYPDGFEEHVIRVKKYTCNSFEERNSSRDSGTLFVADDYKDKGVRIVYDIKLSSHGIIGKDKKFLELFLNLTNTSEDYTEYYKWQNQRVDDIRHGMYEYVGEKSPSGAITVYKVDYSKGWKSTEMTPAANVRSRSTSYNSSHDFKSDWVADE